MFQLHLKVLANNAHITAIVRDRERSNIVLKSETLERLDRIGLQKRLDSLASVQRREIHLAMKDEWRVDLVKVLQTISDL